MRGALAALIDCADRELVCEGRAGTGKTQGILLKLHARAMQYAGSRHLICRATRVSMTQSVLVTYENLLGPDHPAISGNASRENRHSYKYPNGSEIVVGGLEDADRLYSTEWDTVYVAEATEIPFDTWDRFARAMRHNRTPYHQRIADCNPGAPAHWLNERADRCSDELRIVRTRADYDRLQAYNRKPLQGPMRRLVSVHHDNPAYWDLDGWDWTRLGRTYVLGELGSLTGHRRARLLDGRWVGAEGTVFPEFDESRHVIAPFNIPDDWPIYWGYDPGFDHATCILWFTVAPNECIYVIGEIHQRQLGVPQHAANVRARELATGWHPVRRYADPQHAFNRTAQSPKTIAQQWRELGFHLTPWPRSTAVESMVEAVRRRLIDEKLKVFSTCVNCIREFQSWSYKRTAKGEIPAGDDQYEDRDNDAMDVIKGVVAANPRHAPQRGIIVLEGSRTWGAPTSRF